MGYDVDMAYELQQDMGIDIIFIPYRYDRLVEMIRKGQIGVAMGNQNLLDYLNNWLTVMKNNNRAREAYDRWILGKGAEEKKTRWCVIRNVLHWVN